MMSSGSASGLSPVPASMPRAKPTPTDLRLLLHEFLRVNGADGIRHHLDLGVPADALVSPYHTLLQAAVDSRTAGEANAARLAIVDLLISRGADVNLRTRGASGQSTALLLACAGAHYSAHGHAMVQRLLDAGTDVTVRDEKGAGALSNARLMETAVVARLVALGAPGDVPLDKTSALIGALDAKRVDVVELLLKAGADADRWEAFTSYDEANGTSAGGRPLHLARTAALAQVLLAHGADPNGRDRLLQTPLHRSASWQTEGDELYAVLTCLVRAGADLEARDHLGRTPVLAWAERAAVDDIGPHGAQAVLTLLRLGASEHAVSATGVRLADTPVKADRSVSAWRAARAARVAAEQTLAAAAPAP